MTKAGLARERADVLLCGRGLADSRAKAQSLILAGEVFTGTVRVDKPGQLLARECELRVLEKRRFVSRGGDKLEGALEAWGDSVRVREAIAVDVGASTGGFTDCLLQRGAAKVYAVDVGWGQLDTRLRADPRVVVRERTNARDLSAASFDEPIDLVVVDASFIGLDKLLPAIAAFLRPSGHLVALVKPQFEAGRDVARRGRGVIRDESDRQAAIGVARSAIEEHGFTMLREIDSSVLGPKGNRERFVLAVAGEPARAAPVDPADSETSPSRKDG